MSLNKPLREIIEADLQALIDAQVGERKTIEYKQSLPRYDDKEKEKVNGKSVIEEKKEFLADVSALANTAGGYLIFGVKEQDGLPVELCGVQTKNADAEKLRLNSLLQDGLSPRIPGIEIETIEVSSKHTFAFIVHVPQSFLAPHRVEYKHHARFYARNSAGKYDMDVPELRAAFTRTSTLIEYSRNFRAERLSQISTNHEIPAYIDPRLGKIVLHLIPINAFNPTTQIDLRAVWSIEKSHLLQPFTLYNRVRFATDNLRYNFDGVTSVISWPDPEFPRSSYTQVFRNGSIEVVDVSILYNQHNQHIFSGATYERQIVEAMKNYKELMHFLVIEFPLFIMLSFLDGKGYQLSYGHAFDGRKNIDRNHLIVPEMMVENLDGDVARVIKPLFDSIWNAIGQPGSRNYNDDGEFVPPAF